MQWQGARLTLWVVLAGLLTLVPAQVLDFVEVPCMSFDPKQFRECVVRPTLKMLHPEIEYSLAAEELLMLTAAHESHLGTYLVQKGGPALGVYQMEPVTHRDLWTNFIKPGSLLNHRLKLLISLELTDYNNLTGNLFYATAMARVHYFRVKEPLPDVTPNALAKYWKKHWNTELGKGTVNEALANYARYVNG